LYLSRSLFLSLKTQKLSYIHLSGRKGGRRRSRGKEEEEGKRGEGRW
jgi:hypothetical protein